MFAVSVFAVRVFAYIELAVPVKNWTWPVERDETAKVPAIRVPTVAFITFIELVAKEPEAKEEVVMRAVLSVVAVSIWVCKKVVCSE